MYKLSVTVEEWFEWVWQLGVRWGLNVVAFKVKNTLVFIACSRLFGIIIHCVG